MSPRKIRRFAGLLCAGLPELKLLEVKDPRTYVRKWRVSQILGTVLLGLLSRGRSLGETEEFTGWLSVSFRRLLGLPRRLAETMDVLDCQTTVMLRLLLLPIEGQWSYDGRHSPAESIWPHARTFVRIESVVEREGQAPQRDVRIYVTSLMPARLSGKQWRPTGPRSRFESLRGS